MVDRLVDAKQDAHPENQDPEKDEETENNLFTAFPAADDQLCQPQHTGHGKHQIEDILAHAEGQKGQDKGWYILFQETCCRLIHPACGKTEQGRRRGNACGRSILRL